MCFFAHWRNVIFTVVTISNTSHPGYEKVISIFAFGVCICIHTASVCVCVTVWVCMHILNIQYLHTCLCVYVCPSVPIRWEWRSVPLGCLTDISCPFFFRKWMQPITIQGFINSLWASWSYRELMNSVCESAHAKCPPANPTITHNGWDKEMKEESVCLSLCPFSPFFLSDMLHLLSLSLSLLLSFSYNIKTVSI